VGAGAEGVGFVGVKQYQVGIAADGDGALAGKQPKHFGRGSGRKLHKAIEVNASSPHTAVIEQGEAQFYSRCAVGNVVEIVSPKLLGLEDS